MVRLRQRRDLARSRDASDQAYVRPEILNGVAGKRHLEFPQRQETFTCRDRDVDFVGHVRHLVEIVGRDRVLIEERVVLFDAESQLHCLGRS